MTEEYICLYSNTVTERYQKNQLLTTEEIAGILGLKVQTIYTMARRGELEKIKLSRRCVRFRAGVSRSDAMKMVGHKTEAIYRRYAISDERSMKEAAEKLDQFHAIDQQSTEASK